MTLSAIRSSAASAASSLLRATSLPSPPMTRTRKRPSRCETARSRTIDALQRLDPAHEEHDPLLWSPAPGSAATLALSSGRKTSVSTPQGTTVIFAKPGRRSAPRHLLLAFARADHAVDAVRDEPLAVDAMVGLPFVEVMAVLHLAERVEHDDVRDAARRSSASGQPSRRASSDCARGRTTCRRVAGTPGRHRGTAAGSGAATAFSASAAPASIWITRVRSSMTVISGVSGVCSAREDVHRMRAPPHLVRSAGGCTRSSRRCHVCRGGQGARYGRRRPLCYTCVTK